MIFTDTLLLADTEERKPGPMVEFLFSLARVLTAEDVAEKMTYMIHHEAVETDSILNRLTEVEMCIDVVFALLADIFAYAGPFELSWETDLLVEVSKYEGEGELAVDGDSDALECLRAGVAN